jgi:beta-lactam-binding protein with PASTA domain
VVPNLRGKTLGAARRALARAHCRLGRVKLVRSKKVKKGHVVSQSVRPGTRLANGARIGVAVSRGRR